MRRGLLASIRALPAVHACILGRVDSLFRLVEEVCAATCCRRQNTTEAKPDKAQQPTSSAGTARLQAGGPCNQSGEPLCYAFEMAVSKHAESCHGWNLAQQCYGQLP
jgi:hypothetical protein